jgi:P4 family phage/plasmid primase-like protien
MNDTDPELFDWTNESDLTDSTTSNGDNHADDQQSADLDADLGESAVSEDPAAADGPCPTVFTEAELDYPPALFVRFRDEYECFHWSEKYWLHDRRLKVFKGMNLDGVKARVMSYLDAGYAGYNKVETERREQEGIPGGDPKRFPSATVVEAVVARIRSREDMHPDLNPPCLLGSGERRNVINLENCHLYLDGDKPIACEHSPKLFITTRLPYRYDRRAKCPEWLAFLAQTFAGNPDAEKIVEYLQEWFGYNLVFDTQHQRFLVVHGPKGTAKSTLIQALIDVLGYENVSTVMPHRLGDRFSIAQTVGKLANIVGDLSINERIDQGVFKDMVSGGLVTVEEKYKPAYSFYPTARFTFGANQPPVVKDSEDGFWRRMDMIELRNVVQTPNTAMAQPGYWLDREQLPGMFNWSLEGYLRLAKRGEMLRPPGSEQEVNELRLASDPLGDFITNRLVLDPNGQVNMGKVYEAFRTPLKGTSHERNIPHQGAFWKEVRRRYRDLPKPCQPRDESGKQRSILKGLRLV